MAGAGPSSNASINNVLVSILEYEINDIVKLVANSYHLILLLHVTFVQQSHPMLIGQLNPKTS